MASSTPIRYPANILVLEQRDCIGLVDFGLSGTRDRRGHVHVTRRSIDAANENVDVIPRRLGELGVRYDRGREDEFRAELRELFYRYYGASLSEIDPLQVIREGFQLIYSLNLRLPTLPGQDDCDARIGRHRALSRLQRLPVAKPYARGLMLGRFDMQRVISRARKEGWQLAEIAYDIPYQVHDFLEEIRDGQIEVGFVQKGWTSSCTSSTSGLPARHRPDRPGRVDRSSLGAFDNDRPAFSA